MKKLVFLSLLATNTANAQWLANNDESMKALRAERMEMEYETNQTILEKIEEARMRDEQKRAEEFSSLNFSIYGTSDSSYEDTF